MGTDIATEFTRLKTAWSGRESRIAEWYDMRRLRDKYAKEGFESVVLNNPSVQVRLARYVLAGLPETHRIPLMTDDPEEQARIGKAERALRAIWRLIDMRQRMQGRKPWRWELADYLLMTGWYAVFVDVVERDGEPVFLANIWNPTFVYPEWGDELEAVAYEYAVSPAGLAQKAREYGWDVSGIVAAKKYTVKLLWKLEDGQPHTGVVVGGKVVKPYGVAEGYEHIPVLVNAVNGESLWGGTRTGDNLWPRHYGESILEANRDITDKLNRWLGLIMDATRKGVEPNYKHPSKGAAADNVTPQHVEGSGKIIHLDTTLDEDLMPLEVVRVPPEANVVHATLERKLQEGGFPPSMVGSVLSGMSGFAINQINIAGHSVVGEHKAAIEGLMADIDRRWLEEYRRLGMKTRLAVREAGKSELMFEEFSSRDVPKSFFVEVEVPLALPKDKMERLQIARAAKPQGQLLDHLTLLEDILQVQDPLLVMQRIDEDMAAQDPDVQILAKVRSFRRKAAMLELTGGEVEQEEANLLKEAARRLLDKIGQVPQRAPAEQPSAPATSVNPPEMRGGGRVARMLAEGRVPPENLPVGP
jgi:hypothetical protein